MALTPEERRRRQSAAQNRLYHERLKHDPNWLAKEAERKRRLYLKLKQDVIDGYGGRCACCGETTREFLCLDHVNGDGAEHRRSLGGRGATQAVYRLVRRLGFPPEYQLLCANCNLAKERPEGCPHQWK